MTRYFLGANTARGFTSLYGELSREEEEGQVIYIKGGPGNGKSTLMKRVAEAAESAGRTVERCPCSGDPDSLDAVLIREDRVCLVDATSPHVQEPARPGASGGYLDLTVCYRPGLGSLRREIGEKYAQYRACYARCSDLLRAWELTSPRRISGLPENAVREARALAVSFAEKLPDTPGQAVIRRRFLSALTAAGRITFRESAAAVGEVYTVDRAMGLSGTFLEALRSECVRKGRAVILCPDPIVPEETEALLLPEDHMAFLTGEKTGNAVALDSLLSQTALEQHRDEIRQSERIQAELLSAALGELRRAKAFHDELEALYRPYVDFGRVEDMTREQIRRLVDPSPTGESGF